MRDSMRESVRNDFYLVRSSKECRHQLCAADKRALEATRINQTLAVPGKHER